MNIIQIRKLTKLVNKKEKWARSLDVVEFSNMTNKLKDRFAESEAIVSKEANKTVCVDALALVREAILRALDIRLYDTQIMGALALMDSIAEMKTGEGKSLTIVAAAYLRSLQNSIVHVVTLNEYLAKRDLIQATKILQLLEVSSSEVSEDKNSDIIYGSITEFMHDNFRKNEGNGTRSYSTIVDDADEIMIDGDSNIRDYLTKYTNISGATSTGFSEKINFNNTFRVDIIRIPSYKRTIRKDCIDSKYTKEKDKWDDIYLEIMECSIKLGQPVLIEVETTQKAKEVYSFLLKRNVKSKIVDGQSDFEDAEVLTHAGQRGAVTIIANNAGHGIPIKIDDSVTKSVGGLYVIGTFHHKNKRMDTRLRELAGCFGNPGTSRFFITK
jgi:preprotein translocase subunit SecA